MALPEGDEASPTFVRDDSADVARPPPPPAESVPAPVVRSSPGGGVALGSAEAPVTREAEGRYQLRREFGRGGQAVVWLAHDEHVGRDVALKLLVPGSAASSNGGVSTGTATVRFLREARITGQLEHPSIVPVYELGQRADGSLYYTQKLVRGRTLRAALEACQGLADRLKLLSHFADVCNAVAYAHGRGVVHRDLKPENVMVGEFGETVVLDWGLAKVKGQADPREAEQRPHSTTPLELRAAASETRVGSILGTPLYMSPEQALGRLAEVDERSDVWALGAILFEILAGRPPFLGANPTQVLFRVANAPLEPVRKHCPEAPPELTAVAERALNKERLQRYGSARELADEISAWQSGARVLAYSYTTWELAKKLARRNPLATGLAGAALVVLVVAAALIWRAHREAVSYLADALLERADAAEREHRWAYAAVWRTAARMQEDRAEARWGQALDARLAVHPLARLAGHDGEVWGVAYLRDGRLVSCGEDGTLRLWDAQGREVGKLAGHKHRVSALATSSSGLIASGGTDGDIRLWDAAGKLQRVMPTEEEVWTVAFAPDAKTLASAGVEGHLALWDVATGAQLREFDVGQSDTPAISFSPDGARLAAASGDGNIRIFDPSTGDLLRTVALSGRELWSISFTPDGSALVVGGDHGLLRQIPLTAGPRRQLDRHLRLVTSVAHSPDGALMATGSRDGAVRIWDAQSGTPLARMDAGERAVNAVAFSPDGSVLAVAHADERIRLWRIPRPFPLRALPAHTADVRSLALSPDDKLLVSGAEDGQLRFWNTATSTAFKTVTVPGGGWVRGVDVSPDGQLVASAWGDGFARLHDAAGNEVKKLHAHASYATAVAFSPDGKLLATASVDGTIALFRLPDFAEARRIQAHTKVLALGWAPDSKLLAAGGVDKLVHIYDAASGAEAAALPGATDVLRAVRFSPDGRLLAAAGHDRSARIYDVQSRRLVATMDGHEGQIRDLAFSRDGSALATAGTDRDLRLWETATGRLLANLPWHETGVLALAWSRDGRLLASGSGEGNVDLLLMDDPRDLPPPEASLRELLATHWLQLTRLELQPQLPPVAR